MFLIAASYCKLYCELMEVVALCSIPTIIEAVLLRISWFFFNVHDESTSCIARP